jgi:ubiquinone/menaquinone biosynthesis C-methylase UbiE
MSDSTAIPALQDTRERTLPQRPGQAAGEFLVYLKQMALYTWARDRCAGKKVMDLGCGEGYGSALLAADAQWVVAADNSWEAVAHAASKYALPNLAFVVCDAQSLPFRSASFQTVISFEVIEHVADVEAYLREVQRVRASPGVALFSTPNRRLRLLPFQRPWNRYHRREYDDDGFRRALASVFEKFALRGVVGTPEIMEVEKRRVRQNPWIAYPRMIVHLLLPRGVSLPFRREHNRENLQRTAQTDLQRVACSARDYTISDFELRECITLIGDCE